MTTLTCNVDSLVPIFNSRHPATRFVCTKTNLSHHPAPIRHLWLYSPSSRSLLILRLPSLKLRPIPLDLPTLIRLQPYPSPNLVLFIPYVHFPPIPGFSDEGQDGFFFRPPLSGGNFGEVGPRVSTGRVMEGYVDTVGS
jgi:hypothetical protein